jgi:CheY-like chemotaxis protein
MAIQEGREGRGDRDTGRQLRVLFVQSGRLEWLAEGLAREGLRVVTAGTADDALRRSRSELPDVVVLDGDADAPDALGARDAPDAGDVGALDPLALCRRLRGSGWGRG